MWRVRKERFGLCEGEEDGRVLGGPGGGGGRVRVGLGGGFVGEDPFEEGPRGREGFGGFELELERERRGVSFLF